MSGVHRRWNPLNKRWVLVSPHRNLRPWQGQQEPPAKPSETVYDPACYLCPGNPRANGESNPNYASTFAFENDFAALLPDPRPAPAPSGSLLRAVPEAGICRVLCYSPDHSLTMSRMSVEQIASVIGLWREECVALARTPWIRSIQVIENRGAMMGASNPHPHGQIWANQTIPDEIAVETEAQEEHWNATGRSLLADALAEETASGERIVCANEHFVALVPFWAVWPFETMVLPRRHYGAINEQTAEEDQALASVLRELTIRYDNLFETPFPYSFGLHQSPVNGPARPGWHFHMHFYPPLLRSATVRKFLVGYEMLAQPQRDITAETAAERLRDAGSVHYATRSQD
ncbi:MAG: UDP-glucose--hexose-1-phosphate uridylyltransferase [Bryobacterales bacterium]|nr:UDP-glucose--hexose-1-phosphate uridylyltransferase [Bryobacterales bacterium]